MSDGTISLLQGVFFNWASPENVSGLTPPNLLGLAPPLISLSVGIMLRSSDWPPPVRYESRES